jgi:hypothetical protein
LREGMAKELLKSNQLLPIETVINRLSQKLHDELGFDSTLAQWAVESWALALGVKFNSAAIALSPDKGKADKGIVGMGLPQVATPIMPVDLATALQQIKQQPINQAAALQQIKQQPAQSRASQAIIDQFKGWQKIGLQGEKLAVDSLQWAAVIDEKTKLMWAINPNKTADFPNPKEKMTWDEAPAWAKYVNRSGWCGYKDWRLPTIDEIKTLLTKEKQGDVFICVDVFTDINTKYYWVWSSSPVASNKSSAWIVHFGNGNGYHLNKSDNDYVRLVRSSQ